MVSGCSGSAINADSGQRMSRVCESWSLEDLTQMTEEDMGVLLGFYKPDTIPSLKEVRGEPDFANFQFEGSFGWW